MFKLIKFLQHFKRLFTRTWKNKSNSSWFDKIFIFKVYYYLTEGIPINIEYEEDNLRTENITLMIGATVKRKEEFSEIETEYSKYH